MSQDIENMTASCGVGPKGQKVFHTIVRGGTDKQGNLQILVNLTELNKAVEAGAYAFTSKKGDKFLVLNPKVWPPKIHQSSPPPMTKPSAPPQKLSEFLDDDLSDL